MIKVENLTKAFGPKLAVNDVSFTVERGEVLGFLGPNGAGQVHHHAHDHRLHPADRRARSRSAATTSSRIRLPPSA